MKRHAHLCLAIVTAVTLVVALTGCGSDGESADRESKSEKSTTTTEATTTTRPTATTLTASQQAALDKICSGLQAKSVDTINVIASTPANDPIRPAIAEQCPPAPASGAYVMPSGDPVFPGYPLKVSKSSIDDRVANGMTTDEVVALAPGVYAAFNPIVPQLPSYLTGPNSGDCAARNRYFPNTGGSCWDGVMAGSEEPK